jgi:1,4-alpha-glucan branching enzyme
MLWQGQEFAENYIIPDDGPARISFRRSVHWKFFYDNEGQTLISLYRKLGNLRRTISALRSRKTFYYNNHSKPADGLIVYQRTANDESQLAIVFINFSPIEQRLWLPFPQKGSYREKLDDGSTQPQISVQEDEELHEIIIPSHYGRILVKD